MSDQNKTQLTKDVTAAAVTWLADRGFRPIENEVYVTQQWVADVASFAYCSRTEAAKLGIARKLPLYGWKEEDYEAYQSIDWPVTCIIEVKTSKSDFARDDKWRRNSEASLSYVAIPADLAVNTDDLGHWGVLRMRGGKMRIERQADLMPVDDRKRLSLISQIALRRDNATRYGRMDDLQKRFRDQDNSRINRERLVACMKVALGIVQHDMGVDEAICNYLRCSEKVPPNLRQELDRLSREGVKKESWMVYQRPTKT